MIADHEALKVTLPTDREIVFTREFDAPREIVWKAMHDKDLIPRWWGPRNHNTIVEQMDFRPGGKWRFISVDDNGERFGFSGEYIEIVKPEKVVQTIGFDGAPGEPGRTTYTLTERRGRTLLVETGVFPSKEARDAAVASGMESGARETYQRLAELVAELK
jgi:uncharacterized protein YndB with AHSA1/START domain